MNAAERRYLDDTREAKFLYDEAMSRANATLEQAERPIRQKYAELISRDPTDQERRSRLLREMSKEMEPIQRRYRDEVAPIKAEYARVTEAARLRMQGANASGSGGAASPSELARRRQMENRH